MFPALPDSIPISAEMLRLVSEIDEFKGHWRTWQSLTPDRLQGLRHVATIESIGSSTRIEGSRLSDREVEALLSRLETQSFATRDEQEVAGVIGRASFAALLATQPSSSAGATTHHVA